jgi:Glycosyl transferase family 11
LVKLSQEAYTEQVNPLPILRNHLRVRITGGLGNQLFKSMAAIRIGELRGREVALDTTWYEYPRKNGDIVESRKIEIDFFDKLQRLCVRSNFYPYLHLRSGQISRRLPRRLRHRIGYIVESDSYLLDSLWIKTLDGSFEDINLLPSPQVIDSYTKSTKPESPWFKLMKAKIEDQKPTVVHVRMGDYLKLPEIYGFLNRDYYLKALSEMEVKPNTTIWLFSDYPKEALEWLGTLPVKFQVIQTPVDVRAAEVMKIMSLSKNLIIAHSTFSWWAAYLGTINKTTERVIMPNRFLAYQKPSECKLIVPSWHVIKV